MSSLRCCVRLRPLLGVPPLTLTQVRLAGHNKWSNIRHIKAARDGLLSKKNNLYSHKISLGMRSDITIRRFSRDCMYDKGFKLMEEHGNIDQF